MGLFDFLKKKRIDETINLPPKMALSSPTLFRVVTMTNVRESNNDVAEAVIDFNNYAANKIMADPAFKSLYNHYSNGLNIIPKDVPYIICGMSGIDIMNDPVNWIASQTGEPRQQVIDLNGLRLFMIKGTGDLKGRTIQYSVAYYFYIP